MRLFKNLPASPGMMHLFPLLWSGLSCNCFNSSHLCSGGDPPGNAPPASAAL